MNTALLERALVDGLDQLAGQQVPMPTDEAIDQLIAFTRTLVKWNSVYNLTAVREPAQMISRHLLDSLVLNRWLGNHQKHARASKNGGPDATGEPTVDVLDIGSGAGLPVLPLAITRPDLDFVSVEPNGKKTRFQQQVVIELGLKNVQVLQQRVQDISIRAHWITSRAFTAPVEFLTLVTPLSLSDSRVVIMLGDAQRLPDPVPEPYTLEQLVRVDIPNTQSARHVAVCRHMDYT